MVVLVSAILRFNINIRTYVGADGRRCYINACCSDFNGGGRWTAILSS